MARRNNTDPAEMMNQRILAEREERIVREEVAKDMDLGLDLKAKTPENAAELLTDEFDRKAFGEPKTMQRTIYGPDPLVTNCPEFHERLERYGQEEVAAAFKELIVKKSEMAVPDPVMRRSIRKSIERFGKEATAQAFYDRVMRIPSRVVDIDMDDALDPLLVNPMVGIIQRYGRPGFSNKFLSEACNKQFGLRGYQIVKDEHGDPVRMGTLILGEIPTALAERRRQHWADESRALIQEQEHAFNENAEKAIRDSGVRGAQPLARGETVRRSSDVNDEWLNESRDTGVRIG